MGRKAEEQVRHPFLALFDGADPNASTAGRRMTTVPTQALALMNNEFVLKQAELFAQRLAETAGSDAGRQVEAAYSLALARAPRSDEREVAVEFLKEHTLADFAHVVLNLSEFLYVR